MRRDPFAYIIETIGRGEIIVLGAAAILSYSVVMGRHTCLHDTAGLLAHLLHPLALQCFLILEIQQ